MTKGISGNLTGIFRKFLLKLLTVIKEGAESALILHEAGMQMNDANHWGNVTSKFLQFLINTCCQVVNSYTFVTTACCYDIPEHNQHHLSIATVLNLSVTKWPMHSCSSLFCSPRRFIILISEFSKESLGSVCVRYLQAKCPSGAQYVKAVGLKLINNFFDTASSVVSLQCYINWVFQTRTLKLKTINAVLNAKHVHSLSSLWRSVSFFLFYLFRSSVNLCI